MLRRTDVDSIVRSVGDCMAAWSGPLLTYMAVPPLASRSGRSDIGDMNGCLDQVQYCPNWSQRCKLFPY